jgi:hypothetical protein
VLWRVLWLVLWLVLWRVLPQVLWRVLWLVRVLWRPVGRRLFLPQNMYSDLLYGVLVLTLSDVFGLFQFVLIHYGLGRVLVVFA